MDIFLILMIPLLGTTVGSAAVFFMRKTLNNRIENMMTGFASGVMMAASVWSLILPAIEMSEGYAVRFFPAMTGFLLGVGFMRLLDIKAPEIGITECFEDGVDSDRLSRTMKMVLAVTIHNIPEGMAVGVIAAAAARGDAMVSFSSAMALSLGIAIQNFPEGAIVSMPLKALGMKRRKAFLFGALSGMCEPIAGAIALLLTAAISMALPYLLSFAAGAMICVVTEELIPPADEEGAQSFSTLGLALGFVVMMALDVQLG